MQTILQRSNFGVVFLCYIFGRVFNNVYDHGCRGRFFGFYIIPYKILKANIIEQAFTPAFLFFVHNPDNKRVEPMPLSFKGDKVTAKKI